MTNVSNSSDLYHKVMLPQGSSCEERMPLDREVVGSNPTVILAFCIFYRFIKLYSPKCILKQVPWGEAILVIFPKQIFSTAA